MEYVLNTARCNMGIEDVKKHVSLSLAIYESIYYLYAQMGGAYSDISRLLDWKAGEYSALVNA